MIISGLHLRYDMYTYIRLSSFARLKFSYMANLSEIKWIELPSFSDSRGVLTAIESEDSIPFPIKRVFYMYDVTENRGGHAHHETEQLAIAVAGAVKFRLTDTHKTETFLLDNPSRGLYLPPMLFLEEIIQVEPKSVCMVLASTHYDNERYIREYPDYQKLIAEQKK